MKRINKSICTTLGIYGAIVAFNRAEAGLFFVAGVDLFCSIGFFWISFGWEQK